MHTLAPFGLLSALPAVLAAPAGDRRTARAPSRVVVAEATGAVVTPPSCVAMLAPPCTEETKARCDKFADAFIVAKNPANAFEYISASCRVGCA